MIFTTMQDSMGGCLPPAVFNAPPGAAIVGLVWDEAGALTGVATEPLPAPDPDAPLHSESTPISLTVRGARPGRSSALSVSHMQ